MLTTSRKIEISQAVMEYEDLNLIGICRAFIALKLDEQSFSEIKACMYDFAKSIGVFKEGYWWPRLSENTERIEFLEKYIQHLKEQL
jgi:hypothetical protein